MDRQTITKEDGVDVRVIASGDVCNLYEYDPDAETYRLTGILQKEGHLPVDRAMVMGTDRDGEDGLTVLLASRRSVPPGYVARARSIALVEIHNNSHVERQIVAVPEMDEAFSGVFSFEDLPEDIVREINGYIGSLTRETDPAPVWLSVTQAWEEIRQIRRAIRMEHAGSWRKTSSAPLWKPLGDKVQGAGRASDTEPHTEAEFAYLRLPRRFQYYVDEYFAGGERILFAVHRPAMKSAMRSGWFAERLQEGILFLTDQQIAMVTEILPPAESDIRYGYLVHVGAPERIRSVNVRPIGKHSGLEILWETAGGDQRTVWEFPREAARELEEGAELLRHWLPVAGDLRLRRASGPEPVEMELHDPTSVDPEEERILSERLTGAIAKALIAGERVLARALLPAWADKHNTARVFAVTDRRVILVSGSRQADSFPIEKIASVEFTSSILDSWLAIHSVTEGTPARVVIQVPNTSSGFRECFTVLRWQLAVVPIEPKLGGRSV